MCVDSTCCTEYYVWRYDWQKLHRWGDWQPQNPQYSFSLFLPCAAFSQPCDMPKFQCKSKNSSLCLPPEKLCDGVSDCPDHSDEGRLCCELSNHFTPLASKQEISPPPPPPSIWLLCTNMSHVARSGCCMLSVNLKTAWTEAVLINPFITISHPCQ